jgi:RNA polymerase sigma-70 factor (ECF subfamily)
MASLPRRAHLRLVADAADASVEPALAAAAAVMPEPAWENAGSALSTPASTTSPRSKATHPRSSHNELAELSDAQLVALAAQGETAALEQLYRRHAAFGIHLATRIEGSARDVEDVVHDAFVRAFERLGDLNDPAAFRGWLGSIIVHAVRSRLRRHRLMGVLGLRSADPVDLDALASPSASPEVRAQLAQVYALLRTLSADDRIAWTLRVVEGQDLDSVARLARCSLATAKRRITRAQHFLDEHFVPLRKQPQGGAR